MTTLLKDTHLAITILQQSGFSTSQAEAVKDVFNSIDLSALASKTDIYELRAEMYKVAAAQTLVIIGAMIALAQVL